MKPSTSTESTAAEKAAETSNAPAATKETAARVARGTGTTIAIELKDYPDLLEDIRDRARADDREPSKWLRRRIIQNADVLLKMDVEA